MNIIAEAQEVTILQDCLGLNPEQHHIVMSDFSQARSHMMLVMANKLHFWRCLSWRLVSLAYWDMGVARLCAKDILRAIDEGCQASELHHYTTLEFLTSVSPLRLQLEIFAGGRRTLPLLFIPVVERQAERDHSIINKATRGRRPGGPHVSLTMCISEIELALQ